MSKNKKRNKKREEIKMRVAEIYNSQRGQSKLEKVVPISYILEQRDSARIVCLKDKVTEVKLYLQNLILNCKDTEELHRVFESFENVNWLDDALVIDTEMPALALKHISFGSHYAAEEQIVKRCLEHYQSAYFNDLDYLLSTEFEDDNQLIEILESLLVNLKNDTDSSIVKAVQERIKYLRAKGGE